MKVLQGRELLYEHVKSIDDKIDNVSCMELPKGSIEKLAGRELDENEEMQLGKTAILE